MKPATSLLTLLNQAGLLSDDQASELRMELEHNEQSVVSTLAHHGLFPASQMTQVLAQRLHLPIANFPASDYLHLSQTLGLDELALNHDMMPLHSDGTRLQLAVVDPTPVSLIENIQFTTGLTVDLVLTDWVSMQEAQTALRQYRCDQTAVNLNSQETVTSDPEDHYTELANQDSPVNQYLHQLLVTARQKQASDIHIEPYHKRYRIRLRIDGLLTTQAYPTQQQGIQIISRIKILANLNIAEKRRPQDGRFKLRFSERQITDFRVSTIATQRGEKLVLRLLSSGSTQRQLSEIGLSSPDLIAYQHALAQTQGMILVTGPTGSGKTVSLYAGLNYLNSEQLNISTIEDPVEIQFSGLNQIQINSAIHLGFNDNLRTLLRQDPDVIMIGEIRDGETATTAFHAAQTGHLVLSTLHTNSALDTLIRLHQMGVAPYLMASCLKLIIAQRLVRRLCPQCKYPGTTNSPSATLSLTRHWQANPQGCHHCTQGYQGRIGIFEVLPITAPLQHAIADAQSAETLKAIAKAEQFVPLSQQARQLIQQGDTSVDEVIRVLGYEEGAIPSCR